MFSRSNKAELELPVPGTGLSAEGVPVNKRRVYYTFRPVVASISKNRIKVLNYCKHLNCQFSSIGLV